MSSQPRGWQAPPSKPAGCPPGLEYLSVVDQLVIQQQVELLEVFSGWETANKYAVKNVYGQQMYFAAEESNFCIKQCCGPQRPFEIHIMDYMNREVMRMVRPFKCTGCANWSPLFPCCRMSLEVQAPVGTTVGYFQQDCSCIAPRFSITDAQDQVQCIIKGPLCICESPCFPFDQEFTVYSADGQTPLGKIAKKFSGIIKEMLTTADNFTVSFPIKMDTKIKATLLGAVFLIVSTRVRLVLRRFNVQLNPH
ncbi:hypothetical protein NP493_1028g00030 [Ridgeia piscesae]|uniref:Phospholipid scramblase n=1 Tax=Ridgeia piscesae TaxID=27915 RepID=A0AAD9KIJ1_RIDPI|nr:hypothetical protein NP493_1028g00030 [Ridgeia piscesae]